MAGVLTMHQMTKENSKLCGKLKMESPRNANTHVSVGGEKTRTIWKKISIIQPFFSGRGPCKRKDSRKQSNEFGKSSKRMTKISR